MDSMTGSKIPLFAPCFVRRPIVFLAAVLSFSAIESHVERTYSIEQDYQRLTPDMLPAPNVPNILSSLNLAIRILPSRQNDVENTLFPRQVPHCGDFGN